MHYRKLGRTDLEVSLICLGTMTFGEQNSQKEAHAQLDYALEFADRIIALRSGRVFFDGHPAELDADTQAQLYDLAHTESATELEAA